MTIELYGVNINNELTEKQVKELSQLLSEEKQARLKRFYHFKDLKRSLIGEILVRCKINEVVGLANGDIYFDTNDYGKPHLRGDYSFHYNVSHGGDWVVVASHSNPLGVDVEKVKPIEMAIAKRFFSEKEYEDLMGKESNQQLDYFFQLWALKESFIKAVGKGLSIPLDSFSFTIGEEDINITLHKNVAEGDFYFQMYNVDEGHKMALCTPNKEDVPKDIKIKSLENLYQEAMIRLQKNSI